MVHRMRYTYFPKQELKFTHPENMFRSFFLDGWSDRAVRWENARFLTLLTASGRPDQSHRLAPMLGSGPTAKTKNLCTQCSREDCEQGIIPTDVPDPEEMRRVMAESSLPSLLALEQHCVNDTSSGLF